MQHHSLKFYVVHLILPLAFGVWLLTSYPQTGWDLALSDYFYASSLHAFPLKNHYLLDAVLHTGLKSALWFIPLALLGALLWSSLDVEWQVYQRRMAWMLLSMVLALALIQWMKRQSIHACPWDLTRYGGQFPLLPLFANLPLGIKPGHCFPAGHASGGFALFAFYFGLRDSQPRWAYLALGLAFALGALMGWAQLMRGAHFLSHNLWTMWWVWMVQLALYLAWPPIALKPSLMGKGVTA